MDLQYKKRYQTGNLYEIYLSDVDKEYEEYLTIDIFVIISNKA